MNELECPYCGKELEDPDDCYSPDRIYEWECPYCEMNFVFTVEYWPSYDSEKADCLNGGKHNWKNIIGYPKEYFENKRRCSVCSNEKDVTFEKNHEPNNEECSCPDCCQGRDLQTEYNTK